MHIILFSTIIILQICWASLLNSQESSKPAPPGQAGSNRNKGNKPNIIIIVVDDAGWNDFSFHGSPQIPTPNIDTLALNGVILHNYYASPLCTPSRGALMTGKHPIHIRLQHYVIMGGTVNGLPLEEKILPQYLKEFGYSTHLVGKWHLGHARKEYTPTYRGFDSHYGYWIGKQDYYDHFAKEKYGFGYDFRRNMSVDYGAFGKYSTDIFTEEGIRIIETHSSSRNGTEPLFLMINHIAPHSSNIYRPQQAPQENIVKFTDTIQDANRRMYAGVVDKLDESIGSIVEALGKNGMLNNSIIIFTSDNGGAPDGFDLNHGSNFPLRGVKNTLWEGGIRVAGFLWAPPLLLDNSNFVYKNLMHLQDWLPTIIEAIGEDPTTLEGIDGLSHWAAMKGGPPPSLPASADADELVRNVLLHNIDDIYNNSAIRAGDWKLIQGNTSVRDLVCGDESWDGWYGRYDPLPNITVHDLLLPLIVSSAAGGALKSAGFPLHTTKMAIMQQGAAVHCSPIPPPAVTSTCDPYHSPCLFNIKSDPCEYYNLATKHPAIVSSLLAMLQEFNSTATVPIRRFAHKESAPSRWGYIWTNWKDMLTESENDEHES